jgi:D-galacturonate reductase
MARSAILRSPGIRQTGLQFILKLDCHEAMSEKLNVLVVGGGMISEEVILPTVFQERRREKVGHVTVASRRPRTIEHLREVFSSEEFTGLPDPTHGDLDSSHPDCYKEALKEIPRPAVVIVATPDHLHTQVVMDSLDAGLDCIVQKPLCLKADDARAIIKKAGEKAAYVYTDYHKRHDKAIRAARYRYLHGDLGEMLHGHAWIEERREMSLEVFKRWCEKSSPFEYIGVHYVDAYHFITGLKPIRVIAWGQKKFLPKHGKDAYDAIQAVVEWDDESVLFVQTSWVLPDGNPNLTNQGLQLTGTEGTYTANHADRNCNFVTTRGGTETYNPYFFKPYPDWDNPMETEWAGYGGDSLIQPIDDLLLISRKTEGLPEGEARQVRERMIDEFRKTRPLPEEALIGTAVNEAVRISIAGGSAYVVFDENMRPRRT